MTNAVVDQSPVQEAVETRHPAEQFERYDTIDTPRIAVVGFITAILTFVVIVAAQALFFMAADAEQVRKVVEVTDPGVEQALVQQESKLGSYHWVDPQAGIVNIPIEQAMAKVVAEEQAKQAAGEADAN